MDVPGAVADPSTITSEDVTFASSSGVVPAYLARPNAAGAHPGLLVIHEVLGLNDHIRDLTRRFAGAGFIALAPDLYHRTASSSRPDPNNPDPNNRSSFFAMLLSLADSDVVTDLEAAASFLRSLEGANGKVGCIGFCSGGRHTLLLACSSSTLDAAVDCWGGFIDRASPEAETSPARPIPILDLVDRLSCPLLAVGGAEDHNPSPRLLADLQALLERAGKDTRVKVFQGAGHAFLADYRDSYREGPAHELWSDVIAFFDQHLR